MGAALSMDGEDQSREARPLPNPLMSPHSVGIPIAYYDTLALLRGKVVWKFLAINYGRVITPLQRKIQVKVQVELRGSQNITPTFLLSHLRLAIPAHSRIIILFPSPVAAPSRFASTTTASQTKSKERSQNTNRRSPRKRKHRRPQIRRHTQLRNRNIDSIPVNSKDDLRKYRCGSKEQKPEKRDEQSEHRPEEETQGKEPHKDSEKDEDGADDIKAKHPMTGSVDFIMIVLDDGGDADVLARRQFGLEDLDDVKGVPCRWVRAVRDGVSRVSFTVSPQGILVKVMETNLLGSGVTRAARSVRRDNIGRINLFYISQNCIEQEDVLAGNIYQQAGCSHLHPKSIRGSQRQEMPMQARVGEYCNTLEEHPCRFPCRR